LIKSAVKTFYVKKKYIKSFFLTFHSSNNPAYWNDFWNIMGHCRLE